MEERLKALEIAMKREEVAIAFYSEASEKVSKAYAQELFRSFAKDEEKHLEKVKEVYDKLKSERTWPKMITSIGDVVKTKAVFPKYEEELDMAKKDTAVTLEIIKAGLKREEQSITFYHELAEKATDPFETRFFIALEHEERGHYLSLWDYREFLEDPAGWYSMKEGYRLDAG